MFCLLCCFLWQNLYQEWVAVFISVALTYSSCALRAVKVPLGHCSRVSLLQSNSHGKQKANLCCFKETSSLDTKSAVQFREFFNLYFLFISSPVLQALKDQVIKECVVGPRHVAFLLEVSNTEFSIKKMIQQDHVFSRGISTQCFSHLLNPFTLELIRHNFSLQYQCNIKQAR